MYAHTGKLTKDAQHLRQWPCYQCCHHLRTKYEIFVVVYLMVGVGILHGLLSCLPTLRLSSKLKSLSQRPADLQHHTIDEV